MKNVFSKKNYPGDYAESVPDHKLFTRVWCTILLLVHQLVQIYYLNQYF